MYTCLERALFEIRQRSSEVSERTTNQTTDELVNTINTPTVPDNCG